VRVQATRRRWLGERGDEGPAEARRRHYHDPHNAPFSLSTPPRHRNHRQHQIKSHLYAQAPQVGQSADQPSIDVDLRHDDVRNHLPHRRRARHREEQQHDCDGDQVGREDASQAFHVVARQSQQIVLRGRYCKISAMTAPQQEPGEGEKHRHEEVRTRHHAVQQIARIRTGLERDVGDDDAGAGDRAETFQCR